MRFEDTHFPDWKVVEEAVAKVVSESSDPFDPSTLANVYDFIEACRELCPVPKEVVQGYWPTICFSWENLEVEVCNDHYEFYRFWQGHTDLEHFDHTSGRSVPERLLSYLPKRLPPRI